MIQPTSPHAVINEAINDNRRARRFIEKLNITDETNVLYRQFSEMIDELFGAYDFLSTLNV